MTRLARILTALASAPLLVLGGALLGAGHVHEVWERDLVAHDHLDGALMVRSSESCGTAHLHALELRSHGRCEACVTLCARGHALPVTTVQEGPPEPRFVAAPELDGSLRGSPLVLRSPRAPPLSA